MRPPSWGPRLFLREAAALTCPEGSTITAIEFASFGTPTGTCGAFAQSSCHAASSQAVLEAACLGQSTCAVDVSNAKFGGDPCSFVEKNLNVQVTCTGGISAGSGGGSATGGVAGTGGGTGSGGSTQGVVGRPSASLP